MSTTFRVGLSAKLQNSVHSETFCRAAALTALFLMDSAHYNQQLTFRWVNDDANPAQAELAAHKLVAEGCQVVVGHFASAAAVAAAPIYADAGIPLLLPAATAEQATASGSTAFRLCPSDHQLLDAALNTIRQDVSCQHVYFYSDRSMHGMSCIHALRAACTRHQMTYSQWTGQEITAGEPSRRAAVLFAGMYQATVNFVNQLRQQGCRLPIIVLDDAYHSSLLEDLVSLDNTGVVTFGSLHPSILNQLSSHPVLTTYQRIFHELPGIYFLETVAALQICQQLYGYPRCKRIEALSHNLFPTILGDITFRDHSNVTASTMVWRCTRGGFEPWNAGSPQHTNTFLLTESPRRITT